VPNIKFNINCSILVLLPYLMVTLVLFYNMSMNSSSCFITIISHLITLGLFILQK